MKRPMSAFGTKRTWIGTVVMSAFGGKADITRTWQPKADIPTALMKAFGWGANYRRSASPSLD
jgi:hypothetical protein